VKATEVGAKVPFFNQKFFGDDMALMRKTLKDIDRVNVGTITELVGPKTHPLVKQFGVGVKDMYGPSATRGFAVVGGRRRVAMEYSPKSSYRAGVRKTETGYERFAKIGGTSWGSLGSSKEIAVASGLHELGHAVTLPFVPSKQFMSPAIASMTRELAAWKWASKQAIESGMTKEMKMIFRWSRSFGLSQYKRGWAKELGAPVSLQEHYSRIASSLSEKVSSTIREL
jgi:hypothetical protein